MTLESIKSRVIDALPTPVANNFKRFSNWCGRNIENVPANMQNSNLYAASVLLVANAAFYIIAKCIVKFGERKHQEWYPAKTAPESTAAKTDDGKDKEKVDESAAETTSTKTTPLVKSDKKDTESVISALLASATITVCNYGFSKVTDYALSRSTYGGIFTAAFFAYVVLNKQVKSLAEIAAEANQRKDDLAAEHVKAKEEVDAARGELNRLQEVSKSIDEDGEEKNAADANVKAAEAKVKAAEEKTKNIKTALDAQVTVAQKANNEAADAEAKKKAEETPKETKAVKTVENKKDKEDPKVDMKFMDGEVLTKQVLSAIVKKQQEEIESLYAVIHGTVTEDGDCIPGLRQNVESIQDVLDEAQLFDVNDEYGDVTTEGLTTQFGKLKNKVSDLEEKTNGLGKQINKKDVGLKDQVEALRQSGEKLKQDVLRDFAKKADLGTLARKEHLNQYAKTADLDQYAKTTDLDQYAKTADLDQYAKTTDLDQYAKTADLSEEIKTQSEALNTEIEKKNPTVNRSPSKPSTSSPSGEGWKSRGSERGSSYNRGGRGSPARGAGKSKDGQ